MPIQDLPSELIAQVFHYLDTPTFFAARTASKQLQHASLPVFGRRFFRKKGFMVWSPSIDVLASIANHAELRKYVLHVWLNPDCWTFATPDCHRDFWKVQWHIDPSSENTTDRRGNGDDDDDDDAYVSHGLLRQATDKEHTQWRAYSSAKSDHRRLLRTPALEHTLTAIFAALPNLETVGMRRSIDHDAWGWARLSDMVEQDPRILGPIPRGPVARLAGPTKLFVAIITALARSGARIRRLYTDAIELDNISADALPDADLTKACVELRWLEVNVTRAWLYSAADAEGRALAAEYRDDEDHISFDSAARLDSDDDEAAAAAAAAGPGQQHTDSDALFDSSSSSRYGTRLAHLLSSTPHLLGLDLMIFPDRQQRHLVAPVPTQASSWRTSYPYLALETLAQSVQLSDLQRLKLEKITTSTDTVLGLLEPCAKTLRSLKVRDVRLLPPSSASSSAAGGGAGEQHDEARPWQLIFAFLADECPELSYMLLHSLKHAGGGVLFVDEDRADLHGVMDGDDDDVVVAVNGYGGPAGGEVFTKFDNITIEVTGRDEVSKKLEELRQRHWYAGRVFSYALDDDVWFTDTSDEDGG